VPTYQQRFGRSPAPGQLKTKPLKIKPLRIRRSPVHRAPALATREGGVGVLPHLTAHQRQLANRLVGGYEGRQNASASAGKLGSVLQGIGNAYVGARTKAHKHALTGLEWDIAEELAQGSDPIMYAQQAAQAARHPIRQFQSTSKNPAGDRAARLYKEGKISREQALTLAGPPVIGVVGKYPGLGFRVASRSMTRVEAEARLAHLDTKLETFYSRVEKQIGHPYAEADVAREAQGFLNVKGGARGKRAKGTSIEGRVTGAPVRRYTVKQELRGAALNYLEKLAQDKPNHPAVKAWVKAETERADLMDKLHGGMPGEEHVFAGKGAAPPRPPKPPAPPGDFPPHQPPLEGIPPARTPQEMVARSLGTARRLRGEQRKMYSEELSKRVAKAQAALEKAGGGIEGEKAAMRELRGELPKTTFQNLANGKISKAGLEELTRNVELHPDLTFFEKRALNKALTAAVTKGVTPRTFEIKLMRKAFGQEAADAVKTHAGLFSSLVDLSNVPRSLMASFDVSAPFRQGLVAGARHPVLAAKNFGPMFRSFASEHYYQALLDEIHQRPNAELYDFAGVKFTELRGLTSKQREEQFSSGYAERIPVVGHIVRASGRAYTGFLDKMRADMFDRQLELAKKAGVNVEDYTQLHGIARVVNTATGRGGLGPVESWAPALNAVFFSPRLIASRVSLLNPIWYATLPRYARAQAIRSMVQLGAAAGGILATGIYFGGKVQSDPRSADFAKLRLGNTRIDELGGLQQYIRLTSQLASGKLISSTTGKTMTLGPGYGKLTREDIAKRFIVSKFSPPASFVDDLAKGTTFAGQPFSVKQAVVSRMVPLVAQDAYDLYKTKGSIQLALLGYAISMFGIGMQTYGPPPVKAKRYGGGGGGGGTNPLLGGSSSSNPLLPGGGGSSNPLLP